jgi:acyl-CoA reductase-like NAD-dependent aldehyde dehydrogenase
MIERSYERYLGLSQALRLSEPGFIEQFRRMLLSKLRVVFENAGGELDMWSRNASAQVDAQLRERRRAFRRRREALERIQVAAGELEARLAELKLQDERLHQTESRVVALVEDVWSCADAADAGDDTTPPSDEDADAGAVVSMDAPMPVPRLVAAG